MQNTNRTALVTGGTGGIGFAIINKLLEHGINVIATSTSLEKIEQTEKKISKNVSFIHCNLKESDAHKHIFNQVEAKKIQIDILICNAGVNNDNIFLKMTEEEWDNVMQVNLKSTFMLNQIFAKQMIRNRFGRIVNISSVVGFTGNIGQANYVTSKAAIVSMTKNIALELARYSVTANCVAPGFIDTDMIKNMPEKYKEKILERIPMKKIGTADDIANGVCFLCSDEAQYITGTTLHINGGMY